MAPLPLAPIAGALALVVALAIVVLGVTHGLSGPMAASAILGAAAGGLAVWRYDRLPALAVADGLLAGAILVGLSGFAELFVLPLLGMVAATVTAPASQPQPRHLAPPKMVATAFAAGPARSSTSVIRRLRTATLGKLIRPPESEPEELRRTA